MNKAEVSLSNIFELLNANNTLSLNRFLGHSIGVPETLVYTALLSKFAYYKQRNMLFCGGWFYSTILDLQESTTYGEKAQKRAINRLVDIGLLQEVKKFGMPAKRCFLVNEDVAVLQELLKQGKAICDGFKNAEETSSSFEINADEPIEIQESIVTEQPISVEIHEETQPAFSSDSKSQTVGTSTANSSELYNKPKGNKTKVIYPSINRVQNEYVTEEQIQGIADEVKAQIEYDILAYQYDKSTLNNIVELITDVYTAQPHSNYMAYNSTETVKRRYKALNYEHIEYVLDCIKKVTNPIRNIHSYMQKCLFNAPTTMEHYYQTQVNSDMYACG